MQVNNDPQKGWPEGWLIAAAAAVLAAVLSRVMGDVGLVATLFIGAFVFLVFGVLLGMFWGNPLPPASHGHDGHGHAAHDHAAHGHAAHTPAAAPQTAVAMPAQGVTSVAEVATPAMDAAPEIAAAPLAAPIMAAMPVAEVVPDPVSEPASRDAAASDTFEGAGVAPPANPLATEPAEVYAGPASQPVALPGPRDGSADKLQAIEGIGPAMEKLCHDLGIYHFDQIAGWGPGEIAWMDSNLKGFKGRVTRDRWVAQAKLIGQVGIEEFARRAKTNDY